ncbi:MAG: YwdI family protein [Lysinibacillus sp.]|nr:YwdI family protein [Lysinibacillus sp.]
MISYERLFNEIERYTTMAKSAKDEQQLREIFSAIRALCDVALNAKHQPAQTQNIQQLASSHHLPSAKLEEDDANGDSIFDF